MTRLFIRFYLGVLFILVCAWSIQTYVFRQRSDAANIQVVEDALGGGLRLAREMLNSASVSDRPATLDKLQKQFDFPVQIISIDAIPKNARQRFAKGDDVVFVGRGGTAFVLAPLSGNEEALQFGALPTFVGPSQTALMTFWGLVLLLAAGAIALLLRPVVRQLRLVERTATAIADGDFTARVNEQKVTSATTLARAFNKMASRTEAILRTQRELLQAVSHELRTPLSRIHFAIDLILESQDDRQREDRLRSLETASQELDELVGELLRYVRLETSEPALKFSSVELLKVVEELIEKQGPIRERIRFVVDDSLTRQAIVLHVDRPSLERALGNLIGNASRFASNRVVISTNITKEGVVIDIDDDGPGIPEANRLEVFDPFVRLGDGAGGAGLGLAIVRRIVRNHGGNVSAGESPIGGCRIRSVWPNNFGVGNQAPIN